MKAFSGASKRAVYSTVAIITAAAMMACLMQQCAKSAVVEVKVSSDLSGNITSFSYDAPGDLVKLSYEFYNRGSVPYTARIRTDVFERGGDQSPISTGWTGEDAYMPGDKISSDTYFITNSTGVLLLRARAYFGNEIAEQYYEIAKYNRTTQPPTDAFEITGFRTYDDKVVFDVSSALDATGVVVVPSSFPPGWIFEQRAIGPMRKYETTTVSLSYSSTVFQERNVTIAVASDGGGYLSQATFVMRKEGGIWWLAYYIIDSIKLYVSRLP